MLSIAAYNRAEPDIVTREAEFLAKVATLLGPAYDETALSQARRPSSPVVN